MTLASARLRTRVLAATGVVAVAAVTVSGCSSNADMLPTSAIAHGNQIIADGPNVPIAIKNADAETRKATSMTFHQTIAINGTSVKVTGRQLFTADQRRLEARFVMGKTKYDMRQIGPVLYIKSSRTDGKWVLFNIEDTDAWKIATKNNGGTNDDPRQILTMLRANGTVKAAGNEKVGATDTTVYTCKVNIAKVLSALSPQRQKEIKAELASLGSTRDDVKVWIAADGLPRKHSERLTIGSLFTVTSVVVVDSYNDPFTIDVPAPGEIQTFADWSQAGNTAIA